MPVIVALPAGSPLTTKHPALPNPLNQPTGHLKTILILVLGFLVFQYKSNARSVFGIVVALGGVIAYTELKRRMAGPAPASSMASRSSLPLYAKVNTDEIPDDELLGSIPARASLELGPQKV